MFGWGFPTACGNTEMVSSRIPNYVGGKCPGLIYIYIYTPI